MNSVSRRSFLQRIVLKGGAVSVALPLLESVRRNALFAASSIEHRENSPQRIAFMYIPNGVIGERWFPQGSDMASPLPSSLEPLKSLKNHVATINGLNRVRSAGEPHSLAASCWLTSADPNDKSIGDSPINKTLDQIIATQIGDSTPFKSLELSCNSFTDNRESKKYDSISWYAPSHDAKSENNPQQVFQRLFGKAAGYKASVLDSIIDQAEAIKKTLSTEDRQRIEEYLYSIRSIEKRTQRQLADNIKVDMPMPKGIPEDRGQYIRLMGDLMVLALQTDRTRVASLMVGPERWSTPLMFEGVFDKPVNHHFMTHDPNFDDEVAKIDRFHVDQFAYLVKKLNSIQEGDRTLLDNTFFVLGSGLGNGDTHSYSQLPVVIAGRGGTDINLNRHVQCTPGTPLANLWLTLAEKMGVKLARFADSTGPLNQFAG